MIRLRSRQIDAILDIMSAMPFICIENSDSEYPYVVLERIPVPDWTEMSDVPVVGSSLFRERFRDKKTAIFCRNFKNAEAILDAVLVEQGK